MSGVTLSLFSLTAAPATMVRLFLAKGLLLLKWLNHGEGRSNDSIAQVAKVKIEQGSGRDKYRILSGEKLAKLRQNTFLRFFINGKRPNVGFAGDLDPGMVSSMIPTGKVNFYVIVCFTELELALPHHSSGSVLYDN
jgi:hypothetical protein